MTFPSKEKPGKAQQENKALPTCTHKKKQQKNTVFFSFKRKRENL